MAIVCGLRFSTAPMTVDDAALVKDANSEGKPVFTAQEWKSGMKLPPGGLVISYSTRDVDNLNKLGEASDFEGVQKKLASTNLGGAEKVLKIVVDKVAELSMDHGELKEDYEKMKEDYEKMKEKQGKISSTGSSPRILVYDCMRIFADRLTRFYRKLCAEEVDAAARALFGQKVLKALILQKFKVKNQDVTASATFPMFVAGLYAMLADADRFKLTPEEAETLRGSFLQLYRTVVVKYAEEFKDSSASIVSALAPEDKLALKAVLEEWVGFYDNRERRNEGGHVATWNNEKDPGKEYVRLTSVREIFAEMVESGDPEVKEFPRMNKVVLLHYGKYLDEHMLAASATSVLSTPRSWWTV